MVPIVFAAGCGGCGGACACGCPGRTVSISRPLTPLPIAPLPMIPCGALGEGVGSEIEVAVDKVFDGGI